MLGRAIIPEIDELVENHDFATVVDVTGLVIYFSVAGLILGGILL